MAVDVAHGHIFISQGSTTQDTILVTNLSGQKVAAIPGQDGVMGIVLSPDGSTLYAALSSSDAVSAISTATLKPIATYPLGTGDSPQDVAVQSGDVWVSYNTATPGAAAIGDIDLTASSPAFQAQSVMGTWASVPDLAADPSNSGTLVAVETGMDSGDLATFNTASSPVTVLAQGGYPGQCENPGDVAVVPGGSDFILACGFPSAGGVYSTADASPQGSYPASLYPDAVAIDTSGDVAVGGSAPNNGGPYAPDVYVYHQGGSTPLNAFGVNIPYNGELLGRGLAWSPDGSELYAVVTATFSGPTTYTLETVSNPTLTRSARRWIFECHEHSQLRARQVPGVRRYLCAGA
jgi:YVTN family beta-propeller protein